MSEPAASTLKELTHADFYAMANAKVRTKWVEHPEYGRVRIRILRGFERCSNEAARYELNRDTGETDFKFKDVWAALVVRGLAKNDDGERMFPKDDVAEILGKIEGPMLHWLYQEIQAFNKMRLEDRKGLEKNSAGPAANGDGGSDSPSLSA